MTTQPGCVADWSISALLLDQAAGLADRPLHVAREDDATAPSSKSVRGPRPSTPSGSGSAYASPAPPTSYKSAVGASGIFIPGLGAVHASHVGGSVGPAWSRAREGIPTCEAPLGAFRRAEAERQNAPPYKEAPARIAAMLETLGNARRVASWILGNGTREPGGTGEAGAGRGR